MLFRSNDTVSLTVKGTISKSIWNPYNTQNYPKREVRQIILHYTDYMNTPVGIVENLADVYKHKVTGTTRFGIHYSIGRDGYIAKGVPEDQFAYHGNRWNTYGIGIELVNLGNKANNTYRGALVPDLVELPDGFSYASPKFTTFQEYTDEQINALTKLIKEIVQRWPKIGEGIPLYSKKPRNVWDGSFWKPMVNGKLINRRPPMGSFLDVRGANSSNWSTPGIYPHAGSTYGSHTDVAPTPKMLKLLEEFGYLTD